MGVEDLDPDGLYHLASPEEWTAYQEVGVVAPGSLVTEGVVHCSWGRQIPGTLARHFAGATNLLALHLDANALGGVRLVEEDSYGSGESFPHAYGPVPLTAVQGAVAVV